MNTEIPYWKIRNTGVRKSFRALLRNDIFFSKIFNLRAGAEGFIKKAVVRLLKETSEEQINVLDVACGWGVSFAANDNVNFYGVDIEGFPKEIAINNGYADAKVYNDNLDIPYPDEFFEACTILNLNAHVPSELYSDLLKKARRKLKKGGSLLIVAEVNNNGLSYRLMRFLNHGHFDRMVAGMDHTNFVFEEDFDRFLEQNELEVLEKQTLIGNILPFFHYTAWAIDRSPYDLLRYPAFIVDLANSIFDSFLTLIGLGGAGRRFNVGYRCRFLD